METLNAKGFTEDLKWYLGTGKPFFGICLGLQLLFASSEESPGIEGLGIIPGEVALFPQSELSVPQIGWNGLNRRKPSHLFTGTAPDSDVYFVHSFAVFETEANRDWVLTTSDYGVEYVSSVQKGDVVATQFHPEKSGTVGLQMLRAYLEGLLSREALPPLPPPPSPLPPTQPTKRVIACLDVRSNDNGDLVVTKGDQYDVREAAPAEGAEGAGGDGFANEGAVRNLGKPVQLAAR
jgi:glutamine amidotransferase/cyclase